MGAIGRALRRVREALGRAVEDDGLMGRRKKN